MKNIINIIQEEIDNLTEANYNYHNGHGVLNNPIPYGSDNIIMMQGRDTGHFGSGLYFSTYNCDDRRNYDAEYGESGRNSDIRRTLINVNSNDDKGIYRVDFDLYQNLYKVNSSEQAKYLFHCLRSLNNLFYGIYHYNNGNTKKLSDAYLKIKYSMNNIGLKLPEYREFIRLFNKAGDDYTMVRNREIDREKMPESYATLATRIMEYNGFNGVNVSGIYGYDNTKHGSVIYDLNKLSTEPKKININTACRLDLKNDVVGAWDDLKTRILRGESIQTKFNEINSLPEDQQFKLLRRNYTYIGNFIDDFNKYARDIYFKTLPNKIKNNLMVGLPELYDIKAIINNNIKILFDPTIKINDKTILNYVFDKFMWGLSDDDINKIINNLNRPLTQEEKLSYDKYYEEY